jgi:putative membrane fusion protein
MADYKNRETENNRRQSGNQATGNPRREAEATRRTDNPAAGNPRRESETLRRTDNPATPPRKPHSPYRPNGDAKAASDSGTEPTMGSGRRTLLMMHIVWIILGAMILSIIIYQLYISNVQPLKYEYVTLYHMTDTVSFRGIYARYERVLGDKPGGVTVYTHPDGSKIAAGAVVAKSYLNSNDILLQERIEQKQAQIDLLADAEKLENVDNSQLRNFLSQLSSAHSAMMRDIVTGQLGKSPQDKAQMLSLLCKTRIVRGKSTDYTAAIDRLNSEIAELEAQISSLPADVTIAESGYFVSTADGYEYLISPDNASTLTKDELRNILRAPDTGTSSQALGKLIDSYNWSLIGIFDTEAVGGIFVGKPVSIEAGGRLLSMNVRSVAHYEDGESVIVFDCEKIMSAAYVTQRTDSFKLVLDEYDGIRVPSKALHFNVNNEPGVYVKNGVQLKYRLVEIIVSEDEYVICKDTSGKTGYLALYDNIATEGTNLYDGRTVPQ